MCSRKYRRNNKYDCRKRNENKIHSIENCINHIKKESEVERMRALKITVKVVGLILSVAMGAADLKSAITKTA